MDNLAVLNEYSVANTGSSNPMYNKVSWSYETFTKVFQIAIGFIDDSSCMEFDMVGIDTSIVNALRRILIAEVPTMAIDRVYIYNNTSIINDEVLAHRLGLIPIKADPRLFEYRREDDEEGTSEDTIEFELKIKCTKSTHAPKDVQLKFCSKQSVYTRDLNFIPKGEQQRMYGEIRPVDEDILLAKLKPGQEIDLTAHCHKGISRDHAKFSPVATASYRLLPKIELLKEVSGDVAEKLAHSFSDGVIKLIEKDGKPHACVVNARKDTGSRNALHHESLRDVVRISKVKDHFIFSIESTGILAPDVLFLESVGILREKCRHFLTELKSLKIKKSRSK